MEGMEVLVDKEAEEDSHTILMGLDLGGGSILVDPEEEESESISNLISSLDLRGGRGVNFGEAHVGDESCAVECELVVDGSGGAAVS